MRQLFLLLLFSTFSYSRIYKNVKAPVDDRVKDLLSKITLEEKIDYIGRYKDFYIRGMERLGLPTLWDCRAHLLSKLTGNFP